MTFTPPYAFVDWPSPDSLLTASKLNATVAALAAYSEHTEIYCKNATDVTNALITAASYPGTRLALARNTTFSFTSNLLIPPGTSIVGGGISSLLQFTNCDGLVFQVSNYIGPQVFENFAIQGNGYTYTAVKALGDADAGRIQGITFRDVVMWSFKTGFHLRSTHGWHIDHVTGYNLWEGVKVAGQTILLTIDGGSEFSRDSATGSGSSTGMSVNSATDYNPGGVTEKGPEGIRVRDTTFFGFAKSIVHTTGLDCSYDAVTLGMVGDTGFEYTGTPGGLRLRDSWIGFDNGALYGIRGRDLGVENTSSVVIIEGNHAAVESGKVTDVNSVACAIDANQSAVISRNTFTGCRLHDIRLNFSGTCFLDSNKCRSSTAGASIQLVAFPGGPYYLRGNQVATNVYQHPSNTGQVYFIGSTAVINVRDYGALGNGVADDTAAIQAALTAAGVIVSGGHAQVTASVYFPPGDYKYSTVLSVPAGVNIRGEGRATRLWPQGCNGMTFPASTAITPQVIENFWIQNWNAVNTATAFDVPGTTNSANQRLGLTFQNIDVGYFNVGFNLRTAWEVRITNVTGYSIGNGVIVTGQSCRVYVRDSSFNAQGFTYTSIFSETSMGAYTAKFTYTTGGSLGPEDIQFHSTTFLGYDKGIYTKHQLHCVIRDCVLDFCGTVGIQFEESKSLIIEGNYIALGTTAPQFSYGILTNVLGAGNSAKASIKDNYIWCGTTPAPSDAKGIALLDNQDGHVIEANLIFGFDGAGGRDIWAYNNKSLYIVGNRLRSSNLQSIHLENPSGASYVGPNDCLDTITVTAPSVASAATLTLPLMSEIITVTGTTNITSITPQGLRHVKLIFSGALTVTDGSNLKLNGNFVTTADDTLTLVCDGTNWFECTRSPN